MEELDYYYLKDQRTIDQEEQGKERENPLEVLLLAQILQFWLYQLLEKVKKILMV